MSLTETYDFITVERNDGIAAITLARPEKRNALSLGVMRELIAGLEALGNDRSVRVAILRALGPAFSAGHDLREMLRRDVVEYRETFDVCVRLMQTLAAIRQPVIA